jgi:hypothetical protein
MNIQDLFTIDLKTILRGKAQLVSEMDNPIAELVEIEEQLEVPTFLRVITT